jgi:hypothetical protein
VALSNERMSGSSRKDRRCTFGTIKDEHLGKDSVAFIMVSNLLNIQSSSLQHAWLHSRVLQQAQRASSKAIMKESWLLWNAHQLCYCRSAAQSHLCATRTCRTQHASCRLRGRRATRSAPRTAATGAWLPAAGPDHMYIPVQLCTCVCALSRCKCTLHHACIKARM